jgi:hypothetical protein
MLCPRLAGRSEGGSVISEFHDSLHDLIHRRWTVYVCGRRAEPAAIAAIDTRATWADVVVIRGHDDAAAYRTCLWPGEDPLSPARIVWHYISDAELTLWAVLNIQPEAVAMVPYPVPDPCRIPEIHCRPLTILPGRPRAPGLATTAVSEVITDGWTDLSQRPPKSDH